MMPSTWETTAARAAQAASARRWGLTSDKRRVEELSDDRGSVRTPPTPATSEDTHTEVSSSSSPTETEESDHATLEELPKSAMRKKRKPTYYVRKDEMSRLRDEIEALQERLREEEQKRMEANQALSKQLVANAALASNVKQNEIVVTGMRAMICARNAMRDANPLETFIHLTRGEDERRQTLLALQEQKIYEGKEFIDEYCKRVLNPTCAMQDCQTYETKKGDFVLDQFDLTPFEKATTTKQVYDSLLGFFSTQEVSITVMLGVISVRETDDCGESTASQCRIVSTFKSGVQVESNAIMYLRYCDRDDNGIQLEEPYGIFTIDYVNIDEVYPYQTNQRVREDITMVGLIRAFPNPAYEHAPAGQRAGIPEKIVAMARWGFTRLHSANIPLPNGATQELRDSIRAFSDVMPQVMSDIIGTRRGRGY